MKEAVARIFRVQSPFRFIKFLFYYGQNTFLRSFIYVNVYKYPSELPERVCFGEGRQGKGVRNMQVEKAEELYHKYFAAVYSVCFLYMKNQADACDMVQETFLRLIQRRFDYEDEEKAKAWLIVTASNCCKSQLRKSWRKKQVPYDAAVHEQGKEDPDNLILRMVEELEEKYRLPVYLYYFEGYRSAEIAKLLHINASTVRSRLAKARKLLRLELEAGDNPENNSAKILENNPENNSAKNMRKAW